MAGQVARQTTLESVYTAWVARGAVFRPLLDRQPLDSIAFQLRNKRVRVPLGTPPTLAPLQATQGAFGRHRA